MFVSTYFLLVGLFFYLLGVVSVFVFIWYWFYTHEKEDNLARKQSLNESKLPDEIVELIENRECFKKQETCSTLNFALQFFFQERCHDSSIMSWLTNLLTLEFTELLKHRTLSKIINKMEIQNLHLGNNFPVIRSVTPMNAEFVKDSSLLKNIEINVDIEYTGGFQIIIDATTKISKKAVVKIKVVRLCGKGCLELSRYPFTHWSFSFYEEPESEFDVESSVLGRQIPRFKAIIINQLRNLIKRKHTLPYYKLRFAPLIKRTLKPDTCNAYTKEDPVLIEGRLQVRAMKLSRLQPSLIGPSMRFSLTLSEVPLVCAYETPVGVWIIQDVFLTKTQSCPIGVLLRNADDNSQIIETVSVNSVAALAGLRKNDIVLAVNNIPLDSGSQAAKLFTSSASNKKSSVSSHELSIRIKRLIYTDHKRGSIDPLKIEPLSSSSEKSIQSSSQQLLPQATDEEILDRAYHSVISNDKAHSSNPDNILDERSISSPNLVTLEKPVSNNLSPGTPESSRSNSPEAKDFLSMEEEFTEEIPVKKLGSSIPIPIPQHKIGDVLLSPDRKSSISSQSSKAGTPTTGPEVVSQSLPAGLMGLKTPGKKSMNKNRPLIKHLETLHISGSCDPVLDEEHNFTLDAESKYLNICVWSNQNTFEIGKQSSHTDRFSSARDVINRFRKRNSKFTEKEFEKKVLSCQNIKASAPLSEMLNPMTGHPDCVLVGYVNIVISDLVEATKLNTQGCVTKVYTLEPADPNCTEVVNHPLMSHKGFEPSLCYGDITISVVHQTIDRTNLQCKMSEKLDTAIDEDDLTDATLSDDDDSLGDQDECREERDHVFKRTHFNSATQCSFCKKKIWLKDAYQCSECGIICHKKCMLRCQQATVCDYGGLRYREIRDPAPKEDGAKATPEIVMTLDSENSETAKESKSSALQNTRQTIGSFLCHIGSSSSASMKRTGSAQNLAPPFQAFELGLSRSLPPSPQHTPRTSRKDLTYFETEMQISGCC
ncbi:PDZ domain-containing protein 8 [Armadillidium nasatum]|uniref:PDZ domain-containing protein 8 n=1 Tax=Armadillidium nasatum TaxID=96803 RepID=A0A5N5SXX0_9CRUS|nr:PDZ domain-containing protein 8 [Armadillidium nasatum]